MPQPHKGRRRQIGRISDDLAAAVDELGASRGTTRPDTVDALLRVAMNHLDELPAVERPEELPLTG